MEEFEKKFGRKGHNLGKGEHSPPREIQIGQCPHLLNVVCEAGEAEAGDDEDEDQEAELPGALAQREDDGLQTPGVSGDRIEVI